jgi:leucyl aminopeptidase (aminopeptidase T)
VNRVEHAWNLPSEEVYTVPDPERVDGHARLTRPAVVTGRLVPGVSLGFERGRLVEVKGRDGVGQTFGMILLDENSAAHIALGFGFPSSSIRPNAIASIRARITWT